MTYEETAIMEFLRGTPDCFVARKEIARKALKRTVFEENPQWADAPLVSLTNRRLIERNENGHYRILKSER